VTIDFLTHLLLGLLPVCFFLIAHRLPMTFSVGYAAGYEHGIRQSDEWVVSLKIL
jgi:hypothetical protein